MIYKIFLNALISFLVQNNSRLSGSSFFGVVRQDQSDFLRGFVEEKCCGWLIDALNRNKS